MDRNDDGSLKLKENGPDCGEFFRINRKLAKTFQKT